MIVESIGDSLETDSQLWSRAAAGDSAAFGQLFERHGRAVYNFCFRRTADWTVAEDLLSVVFLEVWRRRSELRVEGESVLPLLYGVALNVLRNQRRSLRRFHAALERMPAPRETGDFAEEVASRLDHERAMRRVLEVVARLPETDRDVLSLCAWSGLSYEEAAQALGVPVGTVRSRLSRARARLRELTRSIGHERDDANAMAGEGLMEPEEER